MKPINKKFNIKKCLETIKITENNKNLYRPDGHPADLDDAFLECLEKAATKIKDKNFLKKDQFNKLGDIPKN